MRNIESSEWIGSPNLQVITNEQKQQDLGLSNFSLQAKQIVKSKENKQ
jgi:hypothetical protein